MKKKSFPVSFSFRFVSMTITLLRFLLYYLELLFSFSGTTHLGNKNKGREADTIEKQRQKKATEEKGMLNDIFFSLNKIFWFCSFLTVPNLYLSRKEERRKITCEIGHIDIVPGLRLGRWKWLLEIRNRIWSLGFYNLRVILTWKDR